MDPEIGIDADDWLRLICLEEGLGDPLTAIAKDQSELRDLADQLEESQRTAAVVAARRFQTLDALRLRWERVYGASMVADPAGMNFRALRAEVAAALVVPEVTAEALLSAARSLVHELPATLEAMLDGRCGERHARILADGAAGLEQDQRAELEARALPHAEVLTATKFAKKVRTLRAMLRPGEQEQLHRERLQEREVLRAPAGDGMAWLGAYVPAVTAVAVDNHLDDLARHLRSLDGETRTIAQLRADVFTDLLLDTGAVLPPVEGERGLRESTVRPRGIVPTVHVTAPVLTLAGLDVTPASLDGYGPIDPQTAREIAGLAKGFYRILTAPETGIVLSNGRTKYAVPAELKRYLRQRDQTCRFVGCNRRAVRCDLDHSEDWDHGGRTEHCNLAHFCRNHHRLKHTTAWKVEQEPDGSGTIHLTSPTGRRYATSPEPPTATIRKSKASVPAPGVRTDAQTEWITDGGEAPPPF